MQSRKKMNNFTEDELLDASSRICNSSPGNVLLIGGGTVLPGIIHFQRLRGRSDDLDFITNDEGFEALSSEYILNPAKNMGINDEECYYMYADRILVSFFYNHIRGLNIPEEAYQDCLVSHTTHGDIYTIRPELNIAFKLRRGMSKGHIYTKDGFDYASIISGLNADGMEFDSEALAEYLHAYGCESCIFSSKASCIHELEKGSSNLGKQYRDYFSNVSAKCVDAVSKYCRNK